MLMTVRGSDPLTAPTDNDNDNDNDQHDAIGASPSATRHGKRTVR